MSPYRLPFLATLLTTGCSAKLGDYVTEDPVEAGATISGETVVDNAEGRTDAGDDEGEDADGEVDDTGDGIGEEICDGIDNDGDGEVDEGLLITFFYDRDGDGWGGANDVGCEMPDDAVLTSGDCDDEDASIHPEAEEVCNEIDDNCNLEVDEGLSQTYFVDFDGDGYGSPFATIEACELPDGYTDNDGDCNDASDLISPEGVEICNGTDDDCDGEIDEGVILALYPDADGDGFGIGEEPEYSCSDLPGYSSSTGDCDDEDDTINPEAEEVCDGVDNDCDGGTDDTTESAPIEYWVDADGDGHGAGDLLIGCDLPEGHAISGNDCDDEDADRSPSAEEVCNDIDDDCDLEIDEGIAIEVFPDSDGDGFGLTDAVETVCELTDGFITTPGDCDDDNADINPSAEEVCDEVDNNCNGEADEGLAIEVFPDSDGDGFGLTDAPVTVCEIDPGFTTESGDCNDEDAAINPSAEEVCDEVDNDCNGATDDTPGSTPLEYWLDADGDGFGAGEVLTGCEMPEGYVSNDTDCDDSTPESAPDQEEICDGIDNDCDGDTDEDLTIAVYPDADGDGFGRADDVERRCEVSEGFSDRAGDCDDTDASISPDGIEVCNDKDDNCDDEIDNDATGGLVAYYADADGDGHGTGEPEMACSSPTGFVRLDDDCDDENADRSPSATETCNGLDDNCNGLTDEDVLLIFYDDEDGDGYGTTTFEACERPAGTALEGGDCDDTLAEVNPGASELCDGSDNNCNGLVDDEPLDGTAWFFDSDADGFGDPADVTYLCDAAPAGFVTDSSDCDPTDPDIYPDADERCNGLDDDCDTDIDEEAIDKPDWYLDDDDDGYGTPEDSVAACEAPEGYVDNMLDCADEDDSISPDADEVCDGIDNDCDSDIDGEAIDAIAVYIDADEDGFGSLTAEPMWMCDTDITAGLSTNNLDCDDAIITVNPDGLEVCNGLDDDCDGESDEEAIDRVTAYADADKDGFGAGTDTALLCEITEGWSLVDTDCNDDDVDTYPGAPEYCNGLDNDCDGDEDDSAIDRITIYLDDDEDGYGSSAVSDLACGVREGWTTVGGDCDDDDEGVHPGIEETCDGYDDNCDGIIDNGADDCPCDQRNYGDNSYWFCDDRYKRWTNARNWCEDRNYTLVTINNSAEQTWLKEKILYDSGISNDPYWIGLNDRDDEDDFEWASGEPVTYTAWSAYYGGQPDDYRGEDCVEINRWSASPFGSDWNDLDCNDDIRYICEASP